MVILVGIFYDLYAIQLLTDIWVAFGVGKTTNFSALMLFLTLWGKLNQGLIQSFMYYQAVTQPLHSEEKARSLHGKLGSHLKK